MSIEVENFFKWNLNESIQPSEFGKQVAELLQEWVGLHHLKHSSLKKMKWDDKHYIQMIFAYPTLDTYDFDELTRLVFLAHDYCIRIEISPHAFRYMKMGFSPRIREGKSIWERHPTLEEAVEKWRKNHKSKK